MSDAIMVLGILLALSSCTPNQPTPYLLSGLPEDLTGPELSGSGDQIVSQLCDWAAQNQKPLNQVDASRIYFETFRVLISEAESLQTLSAFLASDRSRQALIMYVDPSYFSEYLASNREQLRLLITSAGLYQFEKLEGNPCPGETLSVGLDEQRCVLVSPISSPPNGEMLRADFRALGGDVPRSDGGRQSVIVRVLSIRDKGHALVGRSIAARGFEPGSFAGASNRRCKPGFDIFE